MSFKLLIWGHILISIKRATKYEDLTAIILTFSIAPLIGKKVRSVH